MAPDFDNPQDQGGDNIYNLTVIASDGTLSTPLAITVTVTDVNEAPVFAAGPTAVTFAENGTGTVFQRAATDPEGARSLGRSAARCRTVRHQQRRRRHLQGGAGLR